jgi:hypothetical protein
MILPNLKITSLANQYTKSFGIDTYEKCINKKHFSSYPYNIDYQYNSRGFRGSEWPSNLDNVYWCIGDSFTNGIGSPYTHTWPCLLSNKLNITTLNVSLDGASNEWITRKIIELLEIKPKYIIVQWSYAHRREADNNLPDEDRRMFVRWSSDTTTEQDIQNTLDCINLVEFNKEKTTIIHTFIPKNIPRNYRTIFKDTIDNMNINIVWFDQLDYARDYHHYDIKTSTDLVEKIVGSGYINI